MMKAPTDLVPFDGPAVLQGELRHQPLTQADYGAMKRATQSRKDSRAWRDTLLLMTLRGTGLRIGEVRALEVRHIGRHGPVYVVFIQREKKRGKAEWESLPIAPALGQGLVEYVKGQHMEPNARVFGLSLAQIRNIVYAAGNAALGHPVPPKALRDLYSSTVNEIATVLLHTSVTWLNVAGKMMGHVNPRTTWNFYSRLTMEQKVAIQEDIET